MCGEILTIASSLNGPPVCYLDKTKNKCELNKSRWSGDNRIRNRALLVAGKSPAEISEQLKVSRTTIYAMKGRVNEGMFKERLKREFLHKTDIKSAFKAEPLKPFREFAADMSVAPSTMSTTVRNMIERPW